MDNLRIIVLVVIAILVLISLFKKSSDNDINTYFLTEEQAELFKYKKYLEDNNFNSYTYGDIEKEQLNYREELKLCELFIQENPNNNYAISQRAFLNSGLHNWDSAIRDLQFLLEKFPTNTNYIRGYIHCYIMQNKNDEALEVLEKYYQNLQKDAEYYKTLGDIYQNSDDFELALKNYEKALELNPNDDMAKLSINTLTEIIKIRKNRQE